MSKRVAILCLTGSLITDAGLPAAAAPVVHLSATMSGPRMEKCIIEVTSSEGGILVEPTATFAQLKGIGLRGVGTPRPAYGLRVYNNARIFFLSALNTRPFVEGFDIGIDSFNCGWLDVEAGQVGGVLFEGNRVGLRSVWDKGQVFFNEFVNNEIGIELRGNFHQDVNANRFFANTIGILWGLAPTPNPDSGVTTQRTMEFNHPIFSGNNQPISVEVTPGVFSPDYRHDPGCFVQWTNMEIDGVVVPNFQKGGPCVSP
jgi:hypothetical protein